MNFSMVGYLASLACACLAHWLGDSVFVYAIAIIVALGNIALTIEERKR